MSVAAAPSLPARGKSPEAFRTISEVSQALDVPQHVLRFWESRFAQVRPVKRAGGRRFYRPEDVALLRGIRTLLYSDGYTIKGVQKVLRDRGWRFVAEAGARAAASPGVAPWEEPDEPAVADGFTEDAAEPADIAATSAESDRIESDGAEPLTGQRAMMASLLRAQGEAADQNAAMALEERTRVRLELLLAELLVLRDRLRLARGGTTLARTLV